MTLKTQIHQLLVTDSRTRPANFALDMVTQATELPRLPYLKPWIEENLIETTEAAEEIGVQGQMERYRDMYARVTAATWRQYVNCEVAVLTGRTARRAEKMNHVGLL